MMFTDRDFAAAGGLISYGADNKDAYRQAAPMSPASCAATSLAICQCMQPTRFELVINLKTAKALGLTVSPMLLGRADEVIE